MLWEHGVAGSNPVIPKKSKRLKKKKNFNIVNFSNFFVFLEFQKLLSICPLSGQIFFTTRKKQKKSKFQFFI
jgi:hypothetical protein